MSNIELTSRLIDGEYPDYEQIIPKTSQTQVVFSKNEMVNAVKAASVFSKIGIYDVTLNFDKSGKISIKSANTQIGENLANINAEVSGENNEIVFNYHYFLEGLSNLSQDKININLINSDSPALLKEVGNEDYLYLIMPIRQ
jgi:DNA polymerase-3 subunit beta